MILLLSTAALSMDPDDNGSEVFVRFLRQFASDFDMQVFSSRDQVNRLIHRLLLLCLLFVLARFAEIRPAGPYVC